MTEPRGAARRILAVDIGGTKIAAAPVTLSDAPEARAALGPVRTTATAAAQGGPAVLQRVVELALAVAEEYAAENPDGPGLSAVGIASAGVVDTVRGRITSATSLMPGWAGTDLASAVGEALGLPVRVLNDVHAHGYGEWAHGFGAGSGSLLLAAVGTGLGGALIDESRLLLGARSMAGHLGHMNHAAAAGLECSCGRTGHIESIASGTGVAAWYKQRMRRRDPSAETGKHVAELARLGQDTAQAVIRESASALGEVLGSAAHLLDPARVVVSGSVAEAGAMWWDALREGFAGTVMDPLADLQPRLGALGPGAPLIGAAIFADGGAALTHTPDHTPSDTLSDTASDAPSDEDDGGDRR